MLSIPSQNDKFFSPTGRVYSKKQTRVTGTQHIFKSGLVKILLLCRINLLNSVNKKKKHVRKFDVRSHMTQKLPEIGVYFNILAMPI